MLQGHARGGRGARRNAGPNLLSSFSSSHFPCPIAGEVTDSNPLVLGGLFAGWYAFNIYFNM
jgi:hypothetical protein